jgi:hypothetical protein
VDWASEDEDSDDNEDENKESVNGPTREVRLLDYACGTGMMSRVSFLTFSFSAVSDHASNYASTVNWVRYLYTSWC